MSYGVQGCEGLGQSLTKEHHGWGSSTVWKAFALFWCAQCHGWEKEGKGEVGVGQLFEMNSVCYPHINAMPFLTMCFFAVVSEPHWDLLCFSSFLQGLTSFPSYPLHWQQWSHADPHPRSVPPACTSPTYLSPMELPLPSVSKPVLLTCSPLLSAFLFPFWLKTVSCPPADKHCFLHSSYLHLSVVAEVLPGNIKRVRAKIGRAVMLKGATTSPSLIHNELWRLLSWNWERRGWEYSPRSFGFSQMQVIVGQQYLI